MKPNEYAFSIPARDGQIIRGVYRDTYEGPVGMFLHGLSSDAEGTKSMRLWSQAERLDRSWIRFDMRAHGKSDGDFEEFSISRAIEDTKLALSLFGGRPKVLVGSSMGGWVASQVALDAEVNVCGQVLIAPAFNFMNGIYLSASPEVQEQWRKSGYRTFDDTGPDCSYTIAYAAVLDSLQYDAFSTPLSYNHPVKILHGALDDVVPSGQSLEFRDHADSDIEVTIFPDGDHRLTDHVDMIEWAVDKIWPD
ncbi:MAG: alpha/beta hydrolase [Acidiferrobacterales bacterium]|nr:alpha/beta hydrolase [Acidiferrobacterales bacterium]